MGKRSQTGSIIILIQKWRNEIMKHILIGGAWPYANGSLHIGHIASLLPGDVLARYWRARGESVFYVSGSDCYGTPITIRAAEEGKTPQEISDAYHEAFCDVFQKLGFSYDLYTKTSDSYHREFVQSFHQRLYESSYTQERTVKNAYCPRCCKVLTDRMIVGICPVCGAPIRGDQCEVCGEIPEPEQIIDAKCADCGTTVEFRETTQIFLLISKLEQELKSYLASHTDWRKNAVAFTKRYIDNGLRDRAITRDLDWGIDVPKDGYEEKKIYIWAENVLGYLSASKKVCEERGVPFEELFGPYSRHYYVHGKDNIPFHTIILPSLLLAHGEKLRLPDAIISCEYLTLEGEKISTSRGHAVWAHELADAYNPDAVRYFFIANGPEKRDSDFSWREFAERNNGELVGAWGNFVNRTLAFIAKYLGNRIPNGVADAEIERVSKHTFLTAGERIERGQFKDALAEIFELVHFGNRYYDAHQPWKTRTVDPKACADTLYNCTLLVADLAVLLKPFLPFSSEKLENWLNLNGRWEKQTVIPGRELPDISVLFEKL